MGAKLKTCDVCANTSEAESAELQYPTHVNMTMKMSKPSIIVTKNYTEQLNVR